MQSNNPVFRSSEEFNGRAANAYGNQTYGGSGGPYPGYGEPRDLGHGHSRLHDPVPTPRAR